MSSNFFDSNYQPNNPGLVLGGYNSGPTQYAAQNPNMLMADISIPALTADPNLFPSFGDKLHDFNSQYGSTVTGGLQAAAGLWGAYNGMQQTKLAKQQMANSLNQWNKSYANQVSSYNTRLEDRQNARVAAQGNYHQDTASYMAKNRLK